MLRWLVRLVRVPPPADAGDTIAEVMYAKAQGPLRPGLSMLCDGLPPAFLVPDQVAALQAVDSRGQKEIANPSSPVRLRIAPPENT